MGGGGGGERGSSPQMCLGVLGAATENVILGCERVARTHIFVNNLI